jgi:dolichyl-diphosphooligosaccharide--protein glycosyltransferase
MSRETASVDSETEDSSASFVLSFWRKWYDFVGLAGVMVFMLWVRLQSLNNFTRGGEVLFSGNDAYYHFREISYTVNNWPSTMPFDPWTAFPYGTAQGQFGTLYDQLVATVALIVGLGNPTEYQVALVTAVAPAILGTLVAIPVYYIGRRLMNRATGLFAVALLAIMPGTFLRRSTVGFADHQVVEVLGMSLSILAFLVALSVVQDEVPVYEQVLDRDWSGLKRPAAYSALAGVAVSLYMWVWPPGLVIVGILGIFFTIALSADFLRGRSPDHVALLGIVSMVVAGGLMAIQVQTTSFSATTPSLLHPVLALAVAVWCGLLAAIARLWEGTGLPDRGYPVTAGGIVVAGLLAMMVAVPDLFNSIWNNVSRSFLFGQSDAALTIAEATPTPGASLTDVDLGQLSSFLFQQYGLTYVVSLVALVWMTVHAYASDYRSEYLLIVVWTAFTWLMALSQVRFHYYLVLPVVLSSAWAFGRALRVTGAPSIAGSLGDVKAYQVFALFAVVLLMFAPLLPPVAASGPTSAQTAQQDGVPQFVVDAGQTGPSGVTWAETGDWMESNTPDPGMEYYGTYGKTEDFEYPPSAYGVMAWWDYGHWITTLSERIPHANPFQENARSASSFFQAQTERRAGLILDAIPSMEQSRLDQFDEMSDGDIQSVVANQTEQEAGEDIRYVMIDDATAGGKFTAIRNWANPPNSTYFDTEQFNVPQVGNRSLPVPNEQFRRTMTYKLYYDDADGLSHYRLVRENDQYSIVGSFILGNRVAQLYSLSPNSERFQGWGQSLSNFSRRVEFARQQGQALNLGRGTFVYNGHVESELKVFERVPGATVTGRIENVSNTSVLVKSEIRTGTGRTFDYIQETQIGADGRFEMTVPYSTTGSVSTADGGTNVSVQATGNYSVLAGISESILGNPIFSVPEENYTAANFDVSERQVYDGATIELGTLEEPVGLQDDASGNESSGNESTSGDGSTSGGDGGNGGSSDDGNGTGSLTAPAPSPELATARTG